MSLSRAVLVAVALFGLLSGCAQLPSQQAQLTTTALPPADVQAVADQPMPPPLADTGADKQAVASAVALATDVQDPVTSGATVQTDLAGRTLYVGSNADFAKLRPGEVILTFDDGPDPAVTPKILEILAEYNAKAVFFMVGKMAKNHPKTAQLVANAGQTIGSHSYGHEKFPKIGYDAAITSIAKSKAAIDAAIAPTGKTLAPFFRFPYMLSTSAVRSSLVKAGWTIFSFDADSWDYLKQSPETILKRTLKRLDASGGGIVLFHDIHARTLKVLPDFLKALGERGYKVVRVVPSSKTTVVPEIQAATTTDS